MGSLAASRVSRGESVLGLVEFARLGDLLAHVQETWFAVQPVAGGIARAEAAADAGAKAEHVTHHQPFSMRSAR